jgi:DNA-directed RNA polymerase subunit RPC12/RpoP
MSLKRAHDALAASRREEDRGSEKVECPDCGHAWSRVYRSLGVERYRECAACGTRYLTEERFKRKIA